MSFRDAEREDQGWRSMGGWHSCR